ncbi:hypothetical protein SLS60_001374 [Paraconiothyrium brasiliense]|uniref:N-acetyltransferase domain-containing protein n=1 Tax=Paraconiothyrium brasiliense TaxID=300254 RepID=A0ABR3S8X8_9PLEO
MAGRNNQHPERKQITDAMADHQETLIKIPKPKSDVAPRVSKHTLPVEEQNRIKDDEIQIEICTVDDALAVAEGLYTCFPDSFWDKMEPPALRDADQATRAKRLAKRLSPSFHLPEMKYIKAVYKPTGQIVGVAGWMLPGMPIHNVWRRTATEFFGFKEMMGWSDADIEEMWRGIDLEAWEKQIGGNDKIRADVLGDEPHWFLAPLMTLPEFQGRGIATKLMKWAIEQADQKGGQPMYLESAPTARNVYMRFGFEPIGEANFLRRGPDGRKGKLWRELVAQEKGEEVGVHVVEKEVDDGELR